MASDITIRCSCGGFEGRAHGLESSVGIRLVCYCDDCQAFPWALDAADRVLDAHGGSDIFQTSPARIEFTKGRENLACLRLSDKGLLRWYASCCNSPIGATLAMASVPFVALLHSAMEFGGSPDAVLGPSRGGVNARFMCRQCVPDLLLESLKLFRGDGDVNESLPGRIETVP